MPRPTRLTPEVQEKIVTAIRAGTYGSVAADYAGIGRRTYFRWLEQGEATESGPKWEFCQAVRSAESEAEVRAVATVNKHMEHSWQAAMTYLERKFPKRWGRHHRVTVGVDPKKELATLLGLDESEIEEAVDLAARKNQERAWGEIAPDRA